ncbi:MAG TPA: hypothetical protein VMP01_04155 [Pirellulaceae bacterium]|nr:hypothetical protein [Pirellulaceae bacterium]
MGVALDLRLIDHQRIVVDGLSIVNDAIRKDDPEVLRRYLGTLPVEVDDVLVAHHRSQLAQLRKMKAPKEIIQIAEQSLRRVSGEPYRPPAFAAANFDELRELLGTWCWMNHCFSLDKAWAELNWFLQPRDATPEPPHYPMQPRVGDPTQTLFDKAIHGAEQYPCDQSGLPIIRTLGSRHADCAGYNPPAISAAILERLETVDATTWPGLLSKYVAMYQRAFPNFDSEMVQEIAEGDLDAAQELFPVLKAAYQRAVNLGFGVSCEVSL